MGIEHWKDCIQEPQPQYKKQLGDVKEDFSGDGELGAGANVGFKVGWKLLEDCNNMCDEEGISFSRFIREALREKLAHLKAERLKK